MTLAELEGWLARHDAGMHARARGGRFEVVVHAASPDPCAGSVQAHAASPDLDAAVRAATEELEAKLSAALAVRPAAPAAPAAAFVPPLRRRSAVAPRK